MSLKVFQIITKQFIQTFLKLSSRILVKSAVEATLKLSVEKVEFARTVYPNVYQIDFPNVVQIVLNNHQIVYSNVSETV